MKEIIKLNTISETHHFLGLEKPKHPLISVLRIGDLIKDFKVDNVKYALNLYQISLKDNCPFMVGILTIIKKEQWFLRHQIKF